MGLIQAIVIVFGFLTAIIIVGLICEVLKIKYKK